MFHSCAAEVGDVFHAGGDSGDAFVVERAPLPAVGDRVCVRANFVGTKALEVLALAEEHAHVRAEEFVGGAGEEIAVERGDVDEAVRAVVDGVDVGEGSGRVGEADDFFTGLMVPTAFEAYPTATSFVFALIFEARSAMSSVQSSS